MTLLTRILLPMFICGALIAGEKKYKGAWFEISYPGAFKVNPSQPSSGVPDKFDSAFFSAPDGSVRFYIFSPQWAGETPDIAVKPGETEKTDKIEKTNGFTQRWFTIKAKSGGFTRSYVENTNEDKTIRWVVGIEYKDQKSYEAHKAAYLKFKKSLRQFAD